MSLMLQILIIFSICLFGNIVSSYLPITIPSSVLSMVFLFILLITKLLKTHQIERLSNFLLSNMAFFFIPAGVGIIETYSTFSDNIIRLLLVCIINTFLTFIVTAGVVTGIVKLQTKNKEKKKNA